MRCFRIQKGNGRYRYIHACSDARERRMYRILHNMLSRIERAAALAAGVPHTAHAFIRERSVVTALQPHIGAFCTMSVDLADWYDSVRIHQVEWRMHQQQIDPKAIRWMLRHAFIPSLHPEAPNPEIPAPRQGLPSSPAAANLAAVGLDVSVTRWLSRLDTKTAYTRYADDLMVSFFEPVNAGYVKERITDLAELVAAYGWRIAERKTEIKWARAGRRVLLGLSVGDSDIRGTRRMRRRARAARHQQNWPEAFGLEAWCAARPPRSKGERASVYRLAISILRDRSLDDSASLNIAADLLYESGLIGLANRMRREEYPRSAYAAAIEKQLRRLRR